MENLIDIPGRLHSVAVEKHVAGTDQIYDDILETTLDILNLGTITDVKKVQGNKLQFLNIKGLVLKEVSIVSEPQKQSDWNLTDSTQVDFIKNRPDIYNKLEIDDKLITKQDIIADLATIRSGAQAGATAYQKPNTGIPVTDLASAVQISLGKADTALQEHQSLAGLVNTGSYNTVSKKIELKHDNTILAEIDATAFIKDGMVSSVTISNGYLVITFNTDAGKEPISIALTDIFNPGNYYTKAQTDNLLGNKVDKEQGKGLSANDYTTEEKTKLGDLPTATELTQTLGSKANTADLANVATSGNYNDLSDKPDLSGFITNSVDNLVNYYLKSETYTKTEVQQLIGAIQQFHYEVYPTLPQTGASNVLYLIGPIGTGADKYEEYVYANNDWTKIGDTSIDLSGYVTTETLTTALADYVTASALSTALAGKADKSEMSVVPGTGANADKTTITLKSGTSVTVLTAHQDISGKEDNSNKVSSWQATPDDIHYPSEKLVKESIDGVDKVFMATFRVTTYKQVVDASNAGKTVALKLNDADTNRWYLTQIGDPMIFTGSRQVGGLRMLDFRTLSSYNVWSDSNFSLGNIERTSNKTTTITGNESSGTYYPTTKAVADYAEKKTDIVAPINTTDATLPITTLACEVGNYYRIDVAVETLAITLPAINSTVVKTVVIYLTAGTTPAVTISAADSKDVYYQDGFEIVAGNTYEINALFNGAAWIVASVKINVE